MDEQLNLFDFIGYPSIYDLDEEEIADIIGGVLGVTFAPAKQSWRGLVAKVGPIELELKKADNYRNEPGRVWLDIGYIYKNKTGGGGLGAESIEEAIRYFKKKVEMTT